MVCGFNVGQKSSARSVGKVLIPPHVTVLLSVYNGERFLAEAIDSILGQSYENYEFIIIDDASTDSTAEILKRYARKDSRIKIVTNPVNLRLAASLNKGISLASGELIARMDADDVSLPDRLEKQVAFMQANPNVSICGTALSVYGSPNTIWLPPLDDHVIKATLLFESCLYHPTVVMRKSIFNGHTSPYSSRMVLAQDYDLWGRLMGTNEIVFANLPEALLCYRVTVGEERREYKHRQGEAANMVRLNLLHRIGLNPTDQEFAAHRALATYERELTTIRLWQCFVWLKKIYSAAAFSGVTSKKALKNEMLRRALHVFGINRKNFFAFSIFFILRLGIFGKRMIESIAKGYNEQRK